MLTDFNFTGIVRPNLKKLLFEGSYHVTRVIFNGPILEARLWDGDLLVARIESDDTTFPEPHTIFGKAYISITGPEAVNYTVVAVPAKDF